MDVAGAAAGRRADDDLRHAGHLGGDDAHQQRRRQGRGTARHVDADRIDGTDQLAQRALFPASIQLLMGCFS